MPPRQSSHGRSQHGSRGPAPSNPTRLPWSLEDGNIDPLVLNSPQAPDYSDQHVSFEPYYPSPVSSTSTAPYATSAPFAWAYGSDQDLFQGAHPQIQYSTAFEDTCSAEGY